MSWIQIKGNNRKWAHWSDWKAQIDQTFKSFSQLAFFPRVRSPRIICEEKSVSTGGVERPMRVHWTRRSLSQSVTSRLSHVMFMVLPTVHILLLTSGWCQFFREVLFTPRCGQHLFPFPPHRAHPQNSIRLSDWRYAFNAHCAHQHESSVGRGPVCPVSSV